jgi:hypothetical protein
LALSIDIANYTMKTKMQSPSPYNPECGIRSDDGAAYISDSDSTSVLTEESDDRAASISDCDSTLVFTKEFDDGATSISDSDTEESDDGAASISDCDSITILTEESDAELHSNSSFPEDDSHLKHMVFNALGYIWGPYYFPDAFIITNSTLSAFSFTTFPPRGIKLFSKASREVMERDSQRGKALCCAFLTCRSLLHKLAFDKSLGEDRSRSLLQDVESLYVQHVGKSKDMEFAHYWGNLLVSLCRVIMADSVSHFRTMSDR